MGVVRNGPFRHESGFRLLMLRAVKYDSSERWSRIVFYPFSQLCSGDVLSRTLNGRTSRHRVEGFFTWQKQKLTQTIVEDKYACSNLLMINPFGVPSVDRLNSTTMPRSPGRPRALQIPSKQATSSPNTMVQQLVLGSACAHHATCEPVFGPRPGPLDLPILYGQRGQRGDEPSLGP